MIYTGSYYVLVDMYRASALAHVICHNFATANKKREGGQIQVERTRLHLVGTGGEQTFLRLMMDLSRSPFG